jgi:hypothetical protein
MKGFLFYGGGGEEEAKIELICMSLELWRGPTNMY